MNILQTIIETESAGEFFVVAEHEENKIVDLRVHPIKNEMVGGALSYTIKELPALVEELEKALS